jgi:hypothetical protein
MTIKQRNTLRTLAMYQGWYMSVSERNDPELYELIYPYKFIQCALALPGHGGLPSWGVTEQGRRVVKALANGSYGF